MKKAEPVPTPKDLFDNYEKIVNLNTILFTTRANVVKAGISKDQLSRLKNIIELDYNTLSHMLAITERTIHLKKEEETFSHIISDRIMAIAELYSYGYRVFGNRDSFNTWMKMPNRYFDGKLPIELMDTQSSAQKVKDEILRYEVGTF